MHVSCMCHACVMYVSCMCHVCVMYVSCICVWCRSDEELIESFELPDDVEPFLSDEPLMTENTANGLALYWYGDASFVLTNTHTRRCGSLSV